MRCLGLAIILMAVGSAQAADDLSVVLKKTLDAHGGQQALSRVVAVRASGKVASAMRKGTVGSLVRVFARPRQLRVEIGYPGEAVERRVLDGDRGWRGGISVAGPPLEAMALQAARLGLPLVLVENRAQLRDGGLVERDGVQLRAIEVRLGVLTVTALVNPVTGVILHSSGKAGPIEFSSSYADFRKVQGVLIPFEERTFAMGRFTGTTTLEKVEVLGAAPEGAFVP